MDIPTPAEVAHRWIEKWAGPGIPSGEFDDFDLDWELPRDNPRLCLDSIVQVLGRISDDPASRYFQVLAAGPLEDLLVHHGPEYVDEIDALARRSPSFRTLLCGVWTSSVDDAVMKRLGKYRDKRW